MCDRAPAQLIRIVEPTVDQPIIGCRRSPWLRNIADQFAEQEERPSFSGEPRANSDGLSLFLSSPLFCSLLSSFREQTEQLMHSSRPEKGHGGGTGHYSACFISRGREMSLRMGEPWLPTDRFTPNTPSNSSPLLTSEICTFWQAHPLHSISSCCCPPFSFPVGKMHRDRCRVFLSLATLWCHQAGGFDFKVCGASLCNLSLCDDDQRLLCSVVYCTVDG